MNEEKNATLILDLMAKKLSENLSFENSATLFKKAKKRIPKLREAYEAQGYKHILKQRDYRAGFLSRLLFQYSEPMHLLEIYIEECIGIGQGFYEGSKIQSNLSKKLYQALIRLHCRSILLSQEIFCLIKNGHASGALARWRSLYETSIIALFISQNGENTAEQYLDFTYIETWKEAKSYNKNYESLGFEILDWEVIQELEIKKNELELKYGKDFSSEYGWARSVITQRKITFKDIEDFVGCSHIRTYYKFSCNPVHAGPKSLFFDIGMIDGVYDSEITLSGSSNIGFTDPAQLAMLSLWNATAALTYLNPTKEIFNGLFFLREQITFIATKFQKIEKQIIKEEQKNRS